jgi:polyphosphate kinase 2 (PPK2 family)
MLQSVDLSVSVEKADFKKELATLNKRLYEALLVSSEAKIPVIILFEGWDAAGKGSTIQKLSSHLDPRKFKTYAIRAPRTHEQKHPWLWRFWLKLPRYGQWAIFDRSWYGRITVERFEKLIPQGVWRRAANEIVQFERTLADDGYLIVKFFLHISKKEQKQRFKALQADPLTAWKIEPEDVERHEHYDDWVALYDDMVARTDSRWAPWVIVESNDVRFALLKVVRTIVERVESRIGAVTGEDVEERTKGAGDDSDDDDEVNSP